MELTQTKFKETELGLIPDDWENMKVKDLLELLTDYDANGSFSSVAENVNVFDSNNFAWYVRSTDLEKKSNLNDVRYVDEDSYKFLKKTALYGGELLFLKRGDIGRVYLFEMRTDYATVAPNLYLLKLNKLTIPSYLFYYFKSDGGQRQLKSKNASSTLGALYKDDVKAINVPLPPLPEQKAIAQVLSDTDNLIQAIEQKLTKKRAIKQGAMQQLLTPKEDWEIKTLGAIAHFYNGKAHEQFIDANGDFKVINSKFVSTGGKVFKSSTVNLCPLKKGDITMVMSDIPNGKALAKCFLIPTDDKYALNQRICAIRTEDVDTEFLYFILNRNKYYLAFDSGTGQTNLKKSDVLDCPIPLPKTKQEQTDIATILLDMNKEIEQLEQKLSKYKMLKQGLMQNLLTGKIRLV